MAVFTPLTEQEISAFLQGYDIGDYQSHQNILQGVENSNFHLFTTMGRYILTIFEARIDKDSLPFVFNLQDHLRAQGVMCPAALGDRRGQKIATLKGKSAAIVEYLHGKTIADNSIMPGHSHSAGQALAKMHMASHGFTMTRANPVDMHIWRDLYAKVRNRLDVDADAIITQAFRHIDHLQDLTLPVGPIHADYFTDNVFFDDAGQVCGIIDFYFSCNGYFAYDLAMALNAWPHMQDFMQGYESIRALSEAERTHLPTLRKAAALRILMTRFYDWYYTPDNAEITPKNPREYLEKLRILL